MDKAGKVYRWAQVERAGAFMEIEPVPMYEKTIVFNSAITAVDSYSHPLFLYNNYAEVSEARDEDGERRNESE